MIQYHIIVYHIISYHIISYHISYYINYVILYYWQWKLALGGVRRPQRLNAPELPTAIVSWPHLQTSGLPPGQRSVLLDLALSISHA